MPLNSLATGRQTNNLLSGRNGVLPSQAFCLRSRRHPVGPSTVEDDDTQLARRADGYKGCQRGHDGCKAACVVSSLTIRITGS
jgi:hypothetical protein